jgi:membrane protein implicated in regulation of membrane protease activity
MSFSDISMVCLIVGLVLAALSVVLGAFGVDLVRHPGHFFSWSGHSPHLGPASHAHGPATKGGGEVSPANFSTAMAFLAWFGGGGLILRRALGESMWIALPGALLSGFFGAWLVYLFVARVLMAHDHAMRPGDYALPGTLATVTLAIRDGGTGEIGYVQGGTRKCAAARCKAGSIARGTEVLVERFEDGVAYVRPFERALAG